jgi:hypothetical protein
MSLPWTKFQDFYLRLGFLKVLVSVLEKSRTSVANELVYRRLRSPLFEAAGSQAPSLWSSVQSKSDWHWYAKEHQSGDYRNPTVAEALLVDGDCESLLFGVTKATEYKILDWGHDVGFVGRGNQITERGLLLRHLFPSDESAAFLGGDVLAWNPFVLTNQERLFFFFHLCQIDRVTAELIGALAKIEGASILELRDAGRLVCRSLHAVLAAADAEVRPSELPALRTARELAVTIAREMKLETEMEEMFPANFGGRVRSRPTRRVVGAGQRHRELTKNTDHQTVPRLEQLTDLGFVAKRAPRFHNSEGFESRRRWRWAPTLLSDRWGTAIAGRLIDAAFLYKGFAGACAETFGLRPGIRQVTGTQIARWTWEAYRIVRRPMGHTPAESVALFAMIAAAEEGEVLEMDAVQWLMLELKRISTIPEHAQFSGGNSLDEMFIRLSEGFVEGVARLTESGHLATFDSAAP